jgi:hypothetical protein
MPDFIPGVGIMTFPSVNAIGGALAIIGLGAVVYFGAQSERPVALPPPLTHEDLAPKAVAPPAPPAPAAQVAPIVKKPPLKFRTVKKMDCSWVPAVTKNYSKDQITAAAQQYGLSPAQVSALRACLN